MSSSIQYFNDVCVSKFSELQEKFCQDPRGISSLEMGVQSIVNKLGREMIKDALEMVDQLIRESDIFILLFPSP